MLTRRMRILVCVQRMLEDPRVIIYNLALPVTRPGLSRRTSVMCTFQPEGTAELQSLYKHLIGSKLVEYKHTLTHTITLKVRCNVIVTK